MNKRLMKDIKAAEHIDVILSFMQEKELLHKVIKDSFFNDIYDLDDDVEKFRQAGDF